MAQQEFSLKPLHLLYLMAIYADDFDVRIHQGHFKSHTQFTVRIGELVDMGLITYNGRHNMTARGAKHINYLLSQRVKP